MNAEDLRMRDLETDNVGLRSITLQQADRFAQLEAELAAARAELDRKRVLRNSDQTRSRCKHYAITLAEIALNGDKNAEAAFRAVMPLLSGSSVSRTKVKEAARIASGGVFGNGDSAYTDAAIDAARSKP